MFLTQKVQVLVVGMMNDTRSVTRTKSENYDY